MANAYLDDRAEFTPSQLFSLIALVLLGTRFVQGFIFWGGASRRLFYSFHPISGVEHAVTRRGMPSISTKQIRHWPTTVSPGW